MKFRDFENGIVITDLAGALDGGSWFLECKTWQDEKFHLLFTQKAFLNNPNPERLPGRIYLNESLVALNSEEEGQILKALTNFSLAEELKATDSDIENDINKIFKGLIEFYRSGAAIEVNEKVEQQMQDKALTSTIKLEECEDKNFEIRIQSPIEERINFRRQTGSDVVVILNLSILPLDKDEIRIYSTRDETMEYAPLLEKGLRRAIDKYKNTRTHIQGFTVEIREGIIHPVDFVPLRVKAYFFGYFSSLFERLKRDYNTE